MADTLVVGALHNNPENFVDLVNSEMYLLHRIKVIDILQTNVNNLQLLRRCAQSLFFGKRITCNSKYHK